MGALQGSLARLAQVPLGETSQAGERRGLQLRQGVTRQRGGEGGGEEGALWCSAKSTAGHHCGPSCWAQLS